MKLFNRILTILLLTLFVTVLSDDDKPFEKLLTGKWEMQQVIQGGEDVTGYHNPYQERWILLKPDKTFESDGRPYSRNTGEWELNSETNELSLINDSETRQNSYWIVSFPDSNSMIWEGARSQYTKDFRIYYSREE